MEHDIIIILASVIFAFQLWIALSNWWRIHTFSHTFSYNTHFEKTETGCIRIYNQESNEEDGVNKIEHNIQVSINNYLTHNQGAVSDFNLIKDIVERNTDAVADEIESQTAIPLYLGLIGTVIGIVFGLATFPANGAGEEFNKGIGSLLGGVGAAMIVSACGVIFTTVSIMLSKRCNAKIEAGKNRFYSWFQAIMLPSISQNAVSVVTQLQKNLAHFNEVFVHTVERLDEKLSGVGDLYDQQMDMLKTIQNIDIRRVAEANIKILYALEKSKKNLETFALYIDNSSEYLHNVQLLNAKLDKHEERNAALTHIADFYRQYADEIRQREQAVAQVSTKLTEKVEGIISDMSAATDRQLQGLAQTFTKQMEYIKRVTDDGESSITGYMLRIDAALEATSKMRDVPAAVSSLAQTAQHQARAIDILGKTVNNLRIAVEKTAGNVHPIGAPELRRPWYKRLFGKRGKGPAADRTARPAQPEAAAPTAHHAANSKPPVPRNINRL